MSTLSKRATPLQKQMLRIIQGAVINTCDAHYKSGLGDMGKGHMVDIEHFARSVAKRAVGTLSAQLADKLAEDNIASVTKAG